MAKSVRQNRIQDRIQNQKPKIIDPTNPRDVTKYKNYWISPQGVLYPVELGFGHECVREQISLHTRLDRLQIDEEYGWIRIRQSVHGLEVGWPTRKKTTQRQLDAIMDMIGALLVAGEKDEAQYLNKQLHEKVSIFKNADALPLREVSPEYLAQKQITDFFISPDGDIYPTRPFEHWMTVDLIQQNFYPNRMLYDVVKSADWIAAHAIQGPQGYFSYRSKRSITQRQIDTLFDLYLAFKNEKQTHKNVLKKIKVFLKEIGIKMARAKEASFLKSIKPQDLAKKGIYDFWMSPEGDVYPASRYNHDKVHDQLVKQYKFNKGRSLPTLEGLYSQGWISGHWLDSEKGSIEQGAFSRHDPTQKQIDALFDMFLGYQKEWADNKRMRALNALSMIKYFTERYGLPLKIKATILEASVRIETKFDDYERALHDQIEDYTDSEIAKQERLQESSFDPNDLADRIEAITGNMPEIRKVRQGRATAQEVNKVALKLLDLRKEADTDTWETLFDLTRDLHDYHDFLEGFDPDKIRKTFADNEEYLLTETQKIVKTLEHTIANAVKRVTITHQQADVNKIIIKPDFMSYEYGRASVKTEPIRDYQVYLGIGHASPSFTIFTNEHGKIEGKVEDVLEGGDTDFFKSPQQTAFYFDLIREIEKPGSTKRPGKDLTLYTARPTKDRRLYDNARQVPVNIFLTSDPNRAAGIAHDLGASEVRDLWRVRINEQFLVQTLDTPRSKDYQTVGGNGRTVPVKRIELMQEGGRKQASSYLTVYHGTSTEKAARQIMRRGIKPQDLSVNSSLSPRQGHIYLTPDLQYALVYALGGDYIGHKPPQSFIKKDGKYGYIFAVDPHTVKKLDPDEDSVGEILYQRKVSWLNRLADYILEDYKTQYPEDYEDEEGFNPSGTYQLLALVEQGEYSAWAEAGKVLLPYMSDDQKLDLISKGAHISYRGKVDPIKCWSINKEDAIYLKRDGSNFFQYAEVCDFKKHSASHLIGNGSSNPFKNLSPELEQSLNRFMTDLSFWMGNENTYHLEHAYKVWRGSKPLQEWLKTYVNLPSYTLYYGAQTDNKKLEIGQRIKRKYKVLHWSKDKRRPQLFAGLLGRTGNWRKPGGLLLEAKASARQVLVDIDRLSKIGGKYHKDLDRIVTRSDVRDLFSGEEYEGEVITNGQIVGRVADLQWFPYDNNTKSHY